MSDWNPHNFHKDPMVNAILNVADRLDALETATNKINHGLRHPDSLSIAEAIEVAVAGARGNSSGTSLSSAVEGVADAIRREETPEGFYDDEISEDVDRKKTKRKKAESKPRRKVRGK